jgi:hypothetical protein
MSATPDRIHLKVISAPSAEDDVPQRSAGAWLLLSTLVVVALWLPLGMLGLWLSRLTSLAFDASVVRFGMSAALASLLAPGVAMLPILSSFALSAFLGGVVVAKFGPVRNGARDASVGALAGAGVASLAAIAGALHPWQLGVMAYVTLMTIGMGSAFLGGRRGRKSRNAANLGRLD